ncbi:MAG: MFS transporter [Cyanobacteria bacterium P01_A01_bin.123]
MASSFQRLQHHYRRLRQAKVFSPYFPVSPAQFSWFYGWVIVAVATIGILMSIPGQTAGVSVFTDHLIEATGLSRLSLSNAYLVGTLTSGLLLPYGGRLLDRLGSRFTVVLSSLWLAGTLVYLSFSDRLLNLISSGLPGLTAQQIALPLLILGFFSLRFSGQGMLTLTSRTTLGKWFDRRRGFVSGLSGVFVSFGFAAAPLIFSLWIGLLDWRGAWLSMALLVGVGMALLGWLFFRDNPEVCGLRMDGDGSREATLEVDSIGSSQKSALEPRALLPPSTDFTRAQAVTTLAFWSTTLALSSQALIITGITFHIVDIGAAVALSETKTVALFLPMAILSTGVGYAIGVVSDRIPLKRLYLLMMGVQAVGILCMGRLDLVGARVLVIAGFGISGGCFSTLSTVTLPRFFGRTHLGAIAGVQMMSMVIASALGPSFLALFQAQFGSYQTGLYLCAIFPVMIFLLLLPTQNPQNS